jgi:hypothetical protein
MQRRIGYKNNEMFKAKYGRDLDDTSARWMQGFPVLADAINRAGSTEAAKIQKALRETDVKPEQLMIGYRDVKFDDTGQNTLSATYLIQLQGKKIQVGMAGGSRERQACLANDGLAQIGRRLLAMDSGRAKSPAPLPQTRRRDFAHALATRRQACELCACPRRVLIDAPDPRWRRRERSRVEARVAAAPLPILQVGPVSRNSVVPAVGFV